MKQTYIIPQTTCVKVQMQSIIAVSSLSNLDEDGGTIGTGGELEGGIESDSRRFGSIWDDDED